MAGNWLNVTQPTGGVAQLWLALTAMAVAEAEKSSDDENPPVSLPFPAFLPPPCNRFTNQHRWVISGAASLESERGKV